MRPEVFLALALLLGAPLTGCLDGGEDLGETSSPETDGSQDAPEEPDGEDEEAPSTNDSAGEPSTNETTTVTDDEEDVENPPTATVAHIDTGINPYHEAFRDDSRLAHTHPSEYIEGFPEDAEALDLSLDAASYEEAVETDADVWANVSQGEVYWIPGTRIVGAISFGDGGTRDGVEETAILDDHGHGTMTASRAVGQGTSLAPQTRFVSIEGLGSQGVRWAAEQGWIDVQTNSWLSFVPSPANQFQDDVPAAELDSESEAFAHAADRMVTIAASGNGLAYTQGAAPMPTYTLSTAPEGVLLVGAHDNGHLAPWSGSPPHLVADGFRGLAAVFDSTTDVEAHGYSCCTSAAAPYAAGAAANIVAEARSLLDDTSLGIEDGIVAEGEAEGIEAGPLADGEFTREELREVLLHTAQEEPVPTYHDGDTHWAADPTSDEPEDATEPGENAYCVGCWSSPVTYEEIPDEVPTYLYTGYGAINVFSDQDAMAVLDGSMATPDREQADTFYQADQDARQAIYPPTGP